MGSDVGKRFMKIQSPSWQIYFMTIAFITAIHSTCLRRAVGAVAAKDDRILATGHNGVWTEQGHCKVFGCLRKQLGIESGKNPEICRGVHAEQNMLDNASIFGIDLKGCDIYCTHYPCADCAKSLIASGVKRVYYSIDYPDDLAKELFKTSGIEIIQVQQG